MSEQKITELDKELSMQKATLNRVLEAQERAANSTEDLNKSVIEMTTEFRYIRTDVERAQRVADSASLMAKDNNTEIKIIKSTNKWQEWAGRAIIIALTGGVIYSLTLNLTS